MIFEGEIVGKISSNIFGVMYATKQIIFMEPIFDFWILFEIYVFGFLFDFSKANECFTVIQSYTLMTNFKVSFCVLGIPRTLINRILT